MNQTLVSSVKNYKDAFLTFFSLFGSLSTLICCALPSLLVSLGMGAVLAGIASNFPGLIWVSENKFSVFIFSGLLLLLNGIMLWKNRNAPCPIDPKLRAACIQGRRISKNVYYLSLIVFGVGFFFAFLIGYIA